MGNKRYGLIKEQKTLWKHKNHARWNTGQMDANPNDRDGGRAGIDYERRLMRRDQNDPRHGPVITRKIG